MILAESSTQPNNADKANPYYAALKKVKFITVNVLTGFYKVEKVLNVFCPDNYRKSGIGKCNFVCKFTGITPFGKILTNTANALTAMPTSHVLKTKVGKLTYTTSTAGLPPCRNRLSDKAQS